MFNTFYKNSFHSFLVIQIKDLNYKDISSYLCLCDLNVMKITKPPTEVYRTSFTRFYTYIVTHKKIVVKTLYFSLICESVGITRLLIFYNFVTILLLGFLYVFRRYGYTIYISYSAFIFTLSMYTD